MTDRHEAPGLRPGNGAMPRAEAVAPPADCSLLSKLAKGDHAALSALYEEWYPRALGLARSMTRRDEAFCLDVVQETFVRVIDHAARLAHLSTSNDLDRWMSAVVRSAAIDLLRRELRRRSRELSVARNPAASDRSPTHTAAELRTLIDSLHPDDQELLMLRFGRGTTLEGAARAVGTTLGAAYGRIRRSIQRLNTDLKDVDHE